MWSISASTFFQLRAKRRPRDGVARIQQARQELNPQPPLLESGALPIELLAYVSACYLLVAGHPAGAFQPATRTLHALLRLPVRCVLAATRAEFLQLHAARIVAAVLLGGVIAFFALRARQSDDRSNIFLRSHSDLLPVAACDVTAFLPKTLS